MATGKCHGCGWVVEQCQVVQGNAICKSECNGGGRTDGVNVPGWAAESLLGGFTTRW
jgi:hypothetical protein